MAAVTIKCPGYLLGVLEEPRGKDRHPRERKSRRTFLHSGLTFTTRTPEAMDEPHDRKVQELSSLLGKLTIANYEKLCPKAKELVLELSSPEGQDQLAQCASLLITVAKSSSHFVHLFAQLARDLASASTPFRRLLLNHCQALFESADFGLVLFVGALFLKGVVTAAIILRCIQSLVPVGTLDDPEEQRLEILCHLLTAVGQQLDSIPSAKPMLGLYFKKFEEIADNKTQGHSVNARMRFILTDVIELRRNGWEKRRG